MKIVELKICITDITDYLTLGENSIVRSIIAQSRDIVKAGGIVTIERRYENAMPTHIVSYKSEQEVDQWKEKLNDVQVILGREKID